MLASLFAYYCMLVIALKANAKVPKIDHVIEMLLHEERKLKGREEASATDEKVMIAGSRYRKKGHKCYKLWKVWSCQKKLQK